MKLDSVCRVAVTVVAIVSNGYTAGPPAARPTSSISLKSSAKQSFDLIIGKPYSAEQITEHQQTLLDGTHIRQTLQRTVFYRDSEGRTRTQRILMPADQSVTSEGVGVIEINDPVAGVQYVIDPHSHTAQKSNLGRIDKQTAIDGPLSSTNPLLAAANVSRQDPAISKESLGRQRMQGIDVEGVRIVVTFPQGFMGNDRPIKNVSETWSSSQLKLLVLSTVSDPRNGELVTKLSRVSQTEPEPSLFRIPPDVSLINGQETRK
jgi:hypothetical protein